eukprot:gene8853-1019_t
MRAAGGICPHVPPPLVTAPPAAAALCRCFRGRGAAAAGRPNSSHKGGVAGPTDPARRIPGLTQKEVRAVRASWEQLGPADEAALGA